MSTLSANGTTIAYTDTGAPPALPDAATIVFGHGLLFSGWMFAAQVQALRTNYRCVTVDWRGQGDSPPASGGYDMDTLTGDARALIEHLDVGAVHYVGLSMGGFVGLRLAARHPELVRSLTLLDTSAEVEEPAMKRKDTLLAHVYRVVGIRPVKAQVMKLMFGPAFLRSDRSAAVVKSWVERLGRSDRAGIRDAVLGVVARAGVTDEIVSITAPTLVVVGEHDAATPPPRSRTMAGLIPGARLEIVSDSGHSSSVEQPEVIGTLITDFLTLAG